MGRSRGRERRGITPNKSVGIYCEGYTEKRYFDMVKRKHSKSNVKVRTEAMSKSHISLVEKVISKEKKEKNDIVVVVFDYDGNDVNNIQQAIALANNHNYYIFYTNYCFELWLLLHFEDLKTKSNLLPLVLNQKLEQYCEVELWNNYKNEKFPDIQNYFEYDIENAIQNAFKLPNGNVNIQLVNQPYVIQQNPYTNIQHDIKKVFNISGPI